jgi:3-hydroxyisobutyrate dehydrogenase-like beta-hydroxyacid dehydrogenase
MQHFKLKAGVVGLGSMGLGVARALVAKGLEVHGFDVRPEPVAALVAAGGRGAATPAALARAVDVLVVLVVNAEQTEAVLFGADGAAPALRKGAVVVSSATVAPDYAAALGDRLGRMGLLPLDAPVSGGAAKAAAGQLTVMASGPSDAFDVARPVLEAMAAKVHRLGDRPGVGSKVKMVNQLLAGVHIAAAAEAMALCLKAGADPAAVYDVICGSAGSSWMFQNRVPHILAGDYTPLSAVSIFVKDLGIVLDSGRRLGLPLPLASTAHQMFLLAAAAGHAGEDDSAVVKIFPGVPLPAARPREG